MFLVMIKQAADKEVRPFRSQYSKFTLRSDFADLAFELGGEELPALVLSDSKRHVESSLEGIFANAKLSYSVFGMCRAPLCAIPKLYNRINLCEVRQPHFTSKLITVS